MMFSSNQVLSVSGCLDHSDELKNALEFGLKAAGYEKDKDLVFQKTEDGRYCIGWCSSNGPEDGWTKFQFDFDVDIVSQIINQYLQSSEIEEGLWDGSYSRGFLMEAIPESMGSEYDGIKRPFYGIISFKPFTCFYSK